MLLYCGKYICPQYKGGQLPQGPSGWWLLLLLLSILLVEFVLMNLEGIRTQTVPTYSSPAGQSTQKTC